MMPSTALKAASNLTLSAAIAALGTASLAQQSCFSRHYDADHLRKTPNQTVRSIALRFEGPATDKSTTGEWADATVFFKDTDTKYTQTLYCSSYGGSHYCGVECDGGRGEIKWKSRDTLLIRTDGFIVSGGCDDEDADTRLVKDNTDGFTTYRLNRAPMDHCPPLGD